MSTRKSKRPKAHSVEGQRLKRIAQRAALHDAICAVGEFMASNGIGSESNDWHTALDAARTSLPVDDSRPLALALTAAAYVVDLNGQRTTETGVKVLTLAAGVVGNPVPLWVFHLYQDVPSWVMQFGSHEMNVNNEACKSVAEHPEWAVARAAASLHLVASRAVSQALSECVARPIVGDDTTAQDLLVGEVGRFAEALARDLGVPWKAGEGDKQPTTLDDAVAMYGETVREAKDAGMFPWDEVLAKRLEVIGTRGREAAELVRNASRTTMAKALDGTAKVGEHTGPGAMLRQWNDPSFEPLGLRWIDTAAKVLWHDKVKPDRERAEHVAPPKISKLLTPVMGHYSKVPQIVGGIAWAFGGAGTEVNGDRYALEPEFTGRRIMAPRSSLLMTVDESRKGYQTSLALELQSERASEQARIEQIERQADEAADLVLGANGAGFISALATKILMLSLADPTVDRGGQVESTVRHWTESTKPGAKRYQARDFNRTIEAFRNIDDTIIYDQELRGGYRFVEVGGIHEPPSGAPLGPDDRVRIGYSKSFDNARDAGAFGPRFAGHFLLNLDAFMRFDDRKAPLMRAYARLSALWNRAFHRTDDPSSGKLRGEYDPRYMPRMDLAAWAMLVNALTPAAIEWMRATSLGTSGKLPDKFRVSAVNDLSAAAGLLKTLGDMGLAKVSIAKDGTVTADPSPEQHEAWRRLRAGSR